MFRLKAFSICVAASLTSAGAMAQSDVRVLGTVSDRATLEAPTVGCFDPAAAAALSRGSDASGGLSELMAVGTCLTLEAGESLNDIQQARVEGRTLLRARPNNAPVHIYMPASAAGLGDGLADYDRAATAALMQSGPSSRELERRARQWMECRSEADRLTSEILDFNASVEATDGEREAAPTGSRIPSATVVVPSMQFRNDSRREQELQARRHELSAARQSLNERCGTVLQAVYDVDYIAYLWHMAGI